VDVVTRTRAQLDLTSQDAVKAFFAAEPVDAVVLAAAKVGAFTPTTPIRPTSSTKT
jgi:dTDP-4-dehydrorhamnose reductase